MVKIKGCTTVHLSLNNLPQKSKILHTLNKNSPKLTMFKFRAINSIIYQYFAISDEKIMEC